MSKHASKPEYKLGVVIRAAFVGTIALASKVAGVAKGAGGASTLTKGLAALAAAGGVTAAAGGLSGSNSQPEMAVQQQQQQQQRHQQELASRYENLKAAQAPPK